MPTRPSQQRDTVRPATAARMTAEVTSTMEYDAIADHMESPLDASKRKKKKSKKEKKQKKHKKAEDEDANDEESAAEVSKSKKEKRHKKKSSGNPDGESGDDTTHEAADAKSDKKRKRELKKKSKEELLAMVPKKDKDGIAYTKLQIRRMTKRVKRGLPPVPTAHEEHERKKNEAQMRREEEAELSGLIFQKNEEKPKEESDDDGDADASDEEDNQVEKEQHGDGSHGDEPSKHASQPDATQQKPAKKSKRNKPVPDDYVCSACKNAHTPRHWIYDCPDKVTVRGTNQKKKRERGLHDPDSRKIFVSGLPFDVKSKDVSQLFEEKTGGRLVSCKLLTFEDTKRCNGQAYLTFETDQAAKDALKISGTVIDSNALTSKANDKKKKKTTPEPKRRELKLKVSKVLNRRKTRK